MSNSEIVVRTVGGYNEERQAISREPVVDDFDLDLNNVELSAADLGCEPGMEYDVELVDEDDIVLDTVRVVAR